ncbi:Uncharacterized protein APZ42_005511 [Daphnia magna]|uniref:Uncharacterized protein n=1 Tax=Daphnia magna TaxID=35525 RepID=A0A164GEN3_9CRUS|nr:Uncharacterized protein APZ42_005511 [Daphnia magna]
MPCGHTHTHTQRIGISRQVTFTYRHFLTEIIFETCPFCFVWPKTKMSIVCVCAIRDGRMSTTHR